MFDYSGDGINGVMGGLRRTVDEAAKGAASHVEAVWRQLQLQEIVRKPD